MAKIILYDLICVSNNIDTVIVKAPVIFAGTRTVAEILTLDVKRHNSYTNITTTNKRFTPSNVVSVINKNVKDCKYVSEDTLIVELEID